MIRKSEKDSTVPVWGFEIINLKEFKVKSREWDLNPRPADYESAALPLSYLGLFRLQN